MIKGYQLRILRQSRGLMQKTLAARMNIAQQRLSALERQDSISELIISKALRALEISKGDALKLLGKINELNEIKSIE